MSPSAHSLPQPVSTDERERLAALHALELLDTPPEPRFDRITQWAAELFGVPIALVSLVDRDRQWFKSVRGIEGTESPRAIALCDHTVRGEGPFVVLDARKHVDFHDNPLVTGAPNIRFYAGAPVVSPSGHPIGSVCVIDSVPRRSFSEWEANALGLLARMASAECAEPSRDAGTDRRLYGERRAFLRELNHEVRTPLNAIVGFSDLLAFGHVGEVNARQRSYLELIQGATRNLLACLDRLTVEAEAPGQGVPGPARYDA